MLYERCIRCGRKLKTDESKELGFGKVCWKKQQVETASKKLFNEKGELNEKMENTSKLSNNINN